MRPKRQYSRPNSPPKSSSSTGPLLVGAGLFAAVVVGLFYAAGSGGSNPTDQTASTAPTASSASTGEAGALPSPTRPEPEQSWASGRYDFHEEIVVEEIPASQRTASVPPRAVEQAESRSPETEVRAAEPAQQSRLKRLQAQLEAGEFGPALETARSGQDIHEQTQLFRLVAEAQMQLGEFHAALGSIRRIPNPRERAQSRGELAAEQAMAGGGMADFTPLMDLIQQETSGPWLEEDGVGGTMSPFETGVRVDPNGLLAHVTAQEQTGRLKALGKQARKADLNEDMAAATPLRLVSLTRLEAEVARRLAEGQPVVESMKHLAGLSQVRYVFIYPEENEIVIGGPAEGWQYNAEGVPVGVNTGTPTLQLDDLVTVLRTFAAGGEGIFGCSINPREAGMRELQSFLEKTSKRPLAPGRTRGWVQQLQDKLGLQDIVFYGVPSTSRVARVIVDADYRMKLIGIGKLDGGPDIPSFFDLLSASQQKDPPTLDALRWWLSMKYDAVLHSPERTVFEIQGSSVLCQSENQIVTAQGQHLPTGKAEATNRLFAENFTQNYAQLAQRDLTFADLQNVFDLALTAALVRHERLAERVGWNLGAFAPGGTYQPAEYAVPQTVMSVANHRVYNGRDVVVQVAGGVRADSLQFVKNEQVAKESPRLQSLTSDARAPELPAGRWWWDAE